MNHSPLPDDKNSRDDFSSRHATRGPIDAVRTPIDAARIPIDREHIVRGQRTLDWFFQTKRWIRFPSQQSDSFAQGLDAAWSLRTRPASETAVQFIFLSPKKPVRRAHDRNRAKRWLRAAAHECEALSKLERILESGDRQLIVMFRISVLPEQLTWQQVAASVSYAALKIVRAVEDIKPSAGEPMLLKRKTSIVEKTQSGE